MQKKIIALAIAGLSGAAFAQSNVTIYGQVNVSYDSISTNAPSQDTLSRVSSNSSRIGFRGEEKLGNGLSAVWQMENAIMVDANSTTTLATRNTFLGLKGGFGEFRAGNHDTPYKLATGSLDVFSDTMGDYNSIISTVGTTNVRDLRLGNVLAYISPTWSGFHAAIATSMLNEAGNAGLSNPSAWSATGIYSNGPLFLSLAWEKQKTAEVLAGNLYCMAQATGVITVKAACAATDTQIGGATAAADAYDTKGVKLGAGYTLGSTKFGLVYERLTDSRTANAGTRNAYVLNVAHTMGSTVLKAAYGKANDGESANLDTSAKNWTLGADYNLSKRTLVYALYTKTTNAANATYGIGVGQVPYAAAAVDQDPSAISIGMKHSF